MFDNIGILIGYEKKISIKIAAFRFTDGHIEMYSFSSAVA